jgi:hypothetical protein
MQVNFEKNKDRNSNMYRGITDKFMENKDRLTINSEKLNKIENDLALVKHQSTNNENLEKRKEESDKHTKEADVSTKVDESQSRNEQDEDEESDDDVCDNDLWIIGTSIVKDLRGRRMHRNKSVRITTLKDKTIYGATQLMKYGRMSAKHIMFQVGSNELENKETDDIMEKLEKLVEVAREKVPHTDILFGEILPRFNKDRRLSSVFEEKRLIFNNLIKDFCKESDMSFIEYDLLRFLISYVDGIHLNTIGVHIMVKCIKRVVNS